jgi:PAS domain S-box-containing protein
VLCNSEKAAALTAEADRLEDQKSKDHRAEGQQRLVVMAESSLDLWAENTALLTVSARTQSEFGLVLSANSAALKMLGYSRLQLERRSLFSILPPPLGAWTEVSLRRYASFGAEGNECVGHSRIMLLAGKSGAVFPALLSIRDAPSETADGHRQFMVIARELRSSSSFVLCNPRLGMLASCAAPRPRLARHHADGLHHRARAAGGHGRGGVALRRAAAGGRALHCRGGGGGGRGGRGGRRGRRRQCGLGQWVRGE